MVNDLQKASFWKRIAAGVFDMILLVILAVGLAFLLSLVLGYDGYSQTLEAAYDRYETEHGITFQISQQEYEAFSEQQKAAYDAAYDALIADKEAMFAYNMLIHLMLIITTVSLLLAFLVMEFLIPLRLGNGQTLGKKIFSLSVMRTDSVKVNTMQVFARAILGKFTVETMIPVYIVLMVFMGIMDVTGTLVLFGIAVAQIVILIVTRSNSLIHDLLAGTVVVDHSSQMIFRTTDDLIKYKKDIAAGQAARQTY